MPVASELIDVKGKINKPYRQRDIMTPFDKFKSVVSTALEPTDFLKLGVTFDTLDAIVQVMTDNQAAERFKHIKAQLFRSINSRSISAA